VEQGRKPPETAGYRAGAAFRTAGTSSGPRVLQESCSSYRPIGWGFDLSL
jgi:hypothetical protein